MKPGIIDWLGRAAMLVLAGMVTLAIIGSIAAIPSESLESRMGIESRERDTIVEEVRPEAAERRPEANSSAPSDTEAAVKPASSGGGAVARSDHLRLARPGRHRRARHPDPVARAA